MTKEGLRYNKGKTRHDLVPAFAQEQYAKVLTKGAEKYAERNWEKGMKWSKVLASMKRHILAFERGEDFDPETGILHMAHVMCNAGFLTEYYKIAPQYDDRPHQYLQPKRIALDIDEVIADFVGAWNDWFGIKEAPEHWNFDPEIPQKLGALPDHFWLDIRPKVDPSHIPFEPCAYITSRPDHTHKWTENWIEANGFPTMPVITVGKELTKVEAIRKVDADVYVDDRYENFVSINREGILCYLMDAPHNRRYNVGYKRVKSLSELIEPKI